MRSEHPRAMARGQSAGHEGMVGVMVEGQWWWWWKDSGGGGRWWWRMVVVVVDSERLVVASISHHPPHRITSPSSSHPPPHHIIIIISSAARVDADLKSSGDSVVADLKSSNGSCSSSATGAEPAAAGPAQSRGQKHTLQLADNRQRSGSDNRHSPGGRGDGKRHRDITRSHAYASLRDSARVAGSGEIVAYSSFEPRKDGYSDPRLDSRVCDSRVTRVRTPTCPKRVESPDDSVTR
ncbi:hypothetical protein BDZ89DRAFT_1258413 [Hymenopellis radicata]|nr:hypothetical protein BDZ89DRAFT_1258413 [Hymenopellis radicata]